MNFLCIERQNALADPTHETGELLTLLVSEHGEELVEVLRVHGESIFDQFETRLGQMNKDDSRVALAPLTADESFFLQALDGGSDRPARQKHLLANRVDRQGTFMEQQLEHGEIGKRGKSLASDALFVVAHHGMRGFPKKEKEVRSGMLVNLGHVDQLEAICLHIKIYFEFFNLSLAAFGTNAMIGIRLIEQLPNTAGGVRDERRYLNPPYGMARRIRASGQSASAQQKSPGAKPRGWTGQSQCYPSSGGGGHG